MLPYIGYKNRIQYCYKDPNFLQVVVEVVVEVVVGMKVVEEVVEQLV
jgi:hypothetical protein